MRTQQRPNLAASLAALLTVPVLTLVFWAIFRLNPPIYHNISYENRPIEWLTVAFLVLAAGIAFATVSQIRKTRGHSHWFLVAFGVGCLFLAIEEINWGQDLLGLQTPAFFLRMNGQQEINVHNFFRTLVGIQFREAYAVVVVLYGVVMPLLARIGGVRRFLEDRKIVIPSLFLAPGFLISGVLAFVDEPTGNEEEYAEMFLSILFLYIALAEYTKARQRQPDAPLVGSKA